MKHKLALLPWSISQTSNTYQDDFSESIFFMGNGRMGVRGYLPFEEDMRGVQKGLYLAGIFGEIKPGITDFVNLPTPVCTSVFIDGKRASLISNISRNFDMKRCLLEVTLTLGCGTKRIDIKYERFFPIDHPELLIQRTSYTANAPLALLVTEGLQTASCNSPIPDDQVKSNDEIVYLAQLKNTETINHGFSCSFGIKGTDLEVNESVLIDAPSFAFSELNTRGGECSQIAYSLKANLTSNTEERIVKVAHISTSRDVDPRICSFNKDTGYSFDELLREHEASWARKWATCDFNLSCEVTAAHGIDPAKTDRYNCALRFNMIQLIMSCSRLDKTVSIGARGLTHGRYKGCYFWDTDMFMLPFFLENDLTAAKSLCEYRVGTLEAAKAHSRKMNTKGARYPWMAALDGSEQCETWDIGCSELHITADIPFALDSYVSKSGDKEFYLEKASELYIETARFWASRYTWDKEHKKVNLLFVKGPDEYCGVSTNNLFTNVMVQNNLRLAITAAEDIEGTPLYNELGITKDEVEEWRHLRDCIIWPHDPETGHLTTDDTFHLLEPVNIKVLKKDASASYHDVCFDRLQRYKVVKQADVLLIMSRLPELFTAEEKMTAWEDFEPICLHDSTLSFASHALFALMNGIKDKGLEYLEKALFLDLEDIMCNTGHEGLHLANMGEVWNAAFHFFS